MENENSTHATELHYGISLVTEVFLKVGAKKMIVESPSQTSFHSSISTSATQESFKDNTGMFTSGVKIRSRYIGEVCI